MTTELVASRAISSRPISLRLIALAALAGLGGCGGAEGDTATAAGEGAARPVKLDSFCGRQELPGPRRETVIAIDSTAIMASPPDRFRKDNGRLVDLLTGLATSQQALETGAMAPRERLTILALDPASGGSRQVFTGCLPGVTPDELAARQASGAESGLDKYMGSDLASDVEDASADFLKAATVAMVSIKAAAPAKDAGTPATMLRVLKALVRQPGDTPRRLFVYTDPSRPLRALPPDYAALRADAFKAAREAQISLGLVDAYVIPARRDLDDRQRGFLDALLLGAGANLRSVAPFSPDRLEPAAKASFVYVGQMPLYANVEAPAELRLNVTAAGRLVNSWIGFTGRDGVKATPLGGEFACDADGACTLKGDPQAGLGQRWRTLAGSTPQPLADAPFGGMRMIEAAGGTESLNVRIFDPTFKILLAGSTPTDIKFKARLVRQEN